MVVIAAACLVVAAALAVGLVRARGHIADLEQQLVVTTAARDEAVGAKAASDADAIAARQARDDALERAQRARRDAADVGARLRDETTARHAAEAAAQEASGRIVVLESEVKAASEGAAILEAALEEAEVARDERAAELEAARRQLAGQVEAPAPLDESAADVLWHLALERVERTWRTSISLGIEDESPLAGSPDPLRTAVEIEIEAAHEEAGSAVDLEWTVETPVGPATALVVLASIESVVQSLAKTAAATTIDVRAAEGGVEVAFAATDDDGRPVAIDLPQALMTGPGRIRVDGSA